MNEVVVRPLRFTEDVQAMREFLETLGLRSRIESERGGWVDMVAGRGMVALHDAATSSTGGQPGQTTLSFEADHLDELQQRLEAAGFDGVTIWDEAYGRVMSVQLPPEQIWIDERSEDLYGYKLHEAEADERWSVTPRLDGVDESVFRRFLSAVGGDSPDLVSYGQAAGYAVHLHFRTSEPVAEVIGRLREAGFEPMKTAIGFTVEDPDGQIIEVRS